MVTLRGTLEILQAANMGKPKSFNDFINITIKKKRLSSATVSKRLAQLILAGALDEIITKSTTGRRIIAYKTTEKGRIIIKHAKELQEALQH